MADIAAIDRFIGRWDGVSGSERANYQLFITDLCQCLDLPIPEPASEDTRENSYVFERRVSFAHGDGTTSSGFIDCYRRGSFVLEAKKVKRSSSAKGFDDALLRARAQGENYSRALPATEGRPPFVVVVDVGNIIELYAEFTRSGATYTPYPDPRSHRIRLQDLRSESTRNRLRSLWLEPLALDPARAHAKVTRDVAVRLANVARMLEETGHEPHDVGAFLTRCLFSMFAEDVELLPVGPDGERAFAGLLSRYRDDPSTLQSMMAALWTDMDSGGFSAALANRVLRFNGKLFKAQSDISFALPLSKEQIDELLVAARANWREVEPSIFGTLLERALNPAERHALGAHYTPRAYVERLVLPTVVEPLRAIWADTQAAALLLANEAHGAIGPKRETKLKEAREVVRVFHHKLCTVRILDPACGSGNFLYVTLEHLKRLEGEVLNQLEALGDSQIKIGLEGETVTLQQLRGIELNERAAALAELVLWIGFLQWHIRTFGNKSVSEPVVHDFGNIENRDAILAYGRRTAQLDDNGDAVTHWDGVTFKAHPATGQLVPDEAAQVPQWVFSDPRQATWPDADFIVGNPPFIGNKRMRDALGDGYVVAVREAWKDVPDTADFVMYWWERAAGLTRTGATSRFGLIATNSLRQTFNRRVVARHLDAKPPLSLKFAIPDHPWVDSADGAAVRISMTVGIAGEGLGELNTVVGETGGRDGEVETSLVSRRGTIHADLTIGPNVASAKRLRANEGLCFQGFVLVGEGFVLTSDERRLLAVRAPQEMAAVRAWKNGRDLSQVSRGCFVIDLFGLDHEQARERFPTLYQHLLDRVKPFRDQVARKGHRDKWWIWGEARPGLRRATTALARVVVTNFAAKHRYFVFELPSTALDHNMYVIATADALHLGVLSSRAHLHWMLRAGSTLEDRPLWINSTCFLPFPFPSDDTGLTSEIAERIRTLAEQLDRHRKSRQAVHPDLTLTAMYNVLEKLRLGAQLTAKERSIHDAGLVSVLKTLHDELDSAVQAAYGWSDFGSDADAEQVIERLLALNESRSADESKGVVRFLRASLQAADASVGRAQLEVAQELLLDAREAPVSGSDRVPWPSGLTEQIKIVADVLSSRRRSLSIDELAACFSARGRWRDRLPIILETLESLGRARRDAEGRWSNASVN